MSVSSDVIVSGEVSLQKTENCMRVPGIVSVLGIPIDVTTLEHVEERINESVRTRERLFISTSSPSPRTRQHSWRHCRPAISVRLMALQCWLSAKSWVLLFPSGLRARTFCRRWRAAGHPASISRCSSLVEPTRLAHVPALQSTP